MARINSMMDMGKRSMANSQTGLQTVGHNIANATTEGYSRQRLETQTAEPVTVGNHRQGTGSKTSAVTRTVNTYLDKQIQAETGKLGMAESREENLAKVEHIFNEANNKGLNRFLGNFFNAFRELANNPESQATRALVKESARYVTEDFKRVNSALKEVQKDIDQQIITEVAEINTMTKEIANLNQAISQVENQGMPANDERDRRELLIKKLGEKINIRYGESKDGQVSITAGNTAILVAGFSHQDLEVSPTHETGTKREGNVDIMYRNSKDGHPYVITKQFTGGKIGGILQVRDEVCNDLLDKLDEMAYVIHNNVNEIHEVGYDRYGQTGIKIFKPLAKIRDASERLELTSAVENDPGRIAAALEPNAPADNRIANTIAGLQSRLVMNDGNSTFDDYFNGLVGEFAVNKRQADMTADHQKNIVQQLNKVRESVSGVSLDEETTKMIEYQKAFDASARLIRTADEMFDTVLSLKKL